MSNLLTKIADVLSGGLFVEVKDLVKTYFPPDMTAEQKAALEIELAKLEMTKTALLNTALAESENAITNRIAQLEGTAQDLRAIPIVGPIVIFFRGMQRLVWGYGTFYANFLWFSGSWKLGDQQESALWIINILVLGFLFGERAIQNVAPLLSELMNKRTIK
jgi:hypothetical protein